MARSSSPAASPSGCIALVADGLGANSQDVLFSGQASIPALVAETSTGVVLLLLVAKALAYAVSLACGFRGGPIFPAIFLGIGVATLPVVWFDVSPTLAIAVGAAAGTAAQTRLLLTSMLFATLLVGIAGARRGPGGGAGRGGCLDGQDGARPAAWAEIPIPRRARLGVSSTGTVMTPHATQSRPIPLLWRVFLANVAVFAGRAAAADLQPDHDRRADQDGQFLLLLAGFIVLRGA